MITLRADSLPTEPLVRLGAKEVTSVSDQGGPGGLEALLLRLREGDASAHAELFEVVYAELHRQARSFMADQRPGHTLQATALVNEAYFKLSRHDDAAYVDRQHFLRVAAKAMGQVLIDHARKRGAEKRSTPGERVELDGLVQEFEQRSGGLVALGAALERLEERDPELVRLVELRFFGGYEVAEVAEILSERTAARMWRTARLFLRDEMGG
jgi:RNA polymerase sigma factor (TIGR02999 family)